MKEIVITNKSGITLPTKKSLVDDDIKIKIDKSLVGIDGISEKNGIITILDQSKPIEISRSSSDITITNSGKKTNIKIGSYSMVSLLDTSESNVIEAENLTPENIKKDVNILGVTGTFEGGSSEDYLEALCNDTLTSYSNSNITKVRDYMFYGNGNIESIDFSNATSIGNAAFYCCFKLTNVNIPLVQKLNQQTFYRCEVLSNIKLPNVSNMSGNNIFFTCSALTDLYLGYNGLVSLGTTYVFNGAPSGLKIHVRSQYADQYADATNWSSLIANGTIVIVGDYSD